MTPADARLLLQEGAAALGLNLAEVQLGQFDRYLAELKRWNVRINLTALTTDQDIVIKLFLDSLALAAFLGKASSLADLGSGAGFPGLVLKIACPELALTLVESRGKKAAFLEYVASWLNLADVAVAPVHLTVPLAREWGPQFDAVVSRAAFSLTQLVKLAGPLLKPGGILLAPKGPALAGGELEAAQRAAGSQGMEPLQLQVYQVPFWAEPRLLVLAHKLK